jgi:CrcB protein
MQLSASLAWSPTVRIAVVAGFLGGFTTYSSFNYEAMRLLEESALGPATIYVLTTVAGGWLSGVLGLAAARLITNALIQAG